MGIPLADKRRIITKLETIRQTAETQTVDAHLSQSDDNGIAGLGSPPPFGE